MKTMIIGLGPEYNYPGNWERFRENNTRFASNHGASLISRALTKQFNGEYIDDFSNPDELSNNYDRCIIAFATHLTSWRDVSVYADFIEKLTIPVYAFSLGIQDYAPGVENVSKLHPSIHRLLSIVLDRSNYVGVRGPYTASLLHRSGFKNVLPIGCPTMFYNMKPTIKIRVDPNPGQIAVTYHRTMTEKLWHLLEGYELVGQDFFDEVVFTENLSKDESLSQAEISRYTSLKNGQNILDGVRKNGVFDPSFDRWFSRIGQKDFVTGARLHGCIAALIQGIPAVMIARDIRVMEIAEFFDIPYYTYRQAENLTMENILRSSNFEMLENTYRLRYSSFLAFLNLNNLSHSFQLPENFNDQYVSSLNDKLTEKQIIFKSLQDIQFAQSEIERGVKNNSRIIDMIRSTAKKVPFHKLFK